MTKFEELYNQPNQSHEVLPTERRKNRRTFYLKTIALLTKEVFHLGSLQAKFPPKTSSAISKTVPRMTTPLFCSAVGTHFMMRACMKTGAATASLTY